MKDLHIYAVTRVHTHEMGLLSRQFINQLVEAEDEAQAFRLLQDKGWGAPNIPAGDAEALAAVEMEKTWSLMQELAGDVVPFNVFRFANDYHNLKAAIKLAYTANAQGDTSAYFVKYGTLPQEMILKAVTEHDFSSLPPQMAATAAEAYEILAQSGNGQLCDMAIDRAALKAVYDAGKKSDSVLLRRYAELTVDSANIKAAVRCCKMNKQEEFIRRAVAESGTLDTAALVAAAAKDMDSVFAYIRTTAYEPALPSLKKSVAEFERWCDNQMMELIRPQRTNNFSIEPLAAFILGRQNEIRMVRLVLSAKSNHLDNSVLEERLRDMYV